MANALNDEYAPAFVLLGRGLELIRSNARVYKRRRDYYEGNHPRVWVTERLREIFDVIADEIGIENWCETAINTPLRRLKVESFTGLSDSDVTAAERIWNDLDLDRTEKDLYLDVLTVGCGYVSLWKDPATGQLEADVNRPEDIAWGPSRRVGQAPAWVVKVWADEVEQRWRATLWEPTTTTRFVGPALQRWGSMSILPDSQQSFEIDPEMPGGPHGFERVPIVEFTMGRGRKPIIDTIQRPQDRLNKLQANRMVAAEFSAFPQRWALTTQQLEDGAVDSRPDRALVMDPGEPDAPTKLGQFVATDLKNYDDAIDRERDTIFTMASLPRHLNVAHGGPQTSGAAIAADEGPFAETVRELQSSTGAGWEDFYELQGLDVEPRWKPAETKDVGTETTAVKTATDAGVPLETALAHYAGWTPEELDEMTALKEQQAADAMAQWQQNQPDPNAVDGQSQQPVSSGQPPVAN